MSKDSQKKMAAGYLRRLRGDQHRMCACILKRIPHTSKAILSKCVSKLPENDRDLLQMRKTAKALAGRIGRSVQGIYSSLARIHNLPVDRVSKNLPSVF